LAGKRQGRCKHTRITQNQGVKNSRKGAKLLSFSFLSFAVFATLRENFREGSERRWK
jgi:hypothetical protein